MTSLEEILGAKALARFRRAGPLRHGLPPAAYLDDRFFQLENDRLFANNWVFVGFRHEFETAGDVRPVTVAGGPVVLVRDGEGQIRAFHNVCRHRGLMLVETPGNLGRLLRCPYHAWAYDLDGSLRAAPYFDGPRTAKPESFDRAGRGLLPVACALWHDWIFVKLNGDPGDFDAFIAPLARQLDGLDFDKVTPIGTVDFGEVRANWKFLMENFIEPYHVQFVHRTTTKQPLADHFTIIVEACLGSGIDVTPADDRRAEGAGRDRLDVSARYLTLFPNFVLGRYFPDQLGVHLNTPLGPARTHQRRAIYWIGDAVPPQAERQGLCDLWRNVHKEDHAMVERLQKGRASMAAQDGGVLSPHWEDSVRRFQELLLQALG